VQGKGGLCLRGGGSHAPLYCSPPGAPLAEFLPTPPPPAPQPYHHMHAHKLLTKPPPSPPAPAPRFLSNLVDHPFHAKPFLAPGADLLNHSPKARVGWRLTASTTNLPLAGREAFSVHTHEVYPAEGMQVYNHYQVRGCVALPATPLPPAHTQLAGRGGLLRFKWSLCGGGGSRRGRGVLLATQASPMRGGVVHRMQPVWRGQP
jgi:hypothetical protein